MSKGEGNLVRPTPAMPEIASPHCGAAAYRSPSLSEIYKNLGRLGKEKMRIKGKKSFRRRGRLAVALATAISGCAGQPSHFIGPVQPRSGVCDPASRASLSLHDGFIQFAPNEGSLTLTGQIQPDGSYTAAWVPPNAQSHPGNFTLTAHSTPDGAVDGTYATPRCTYRVHLTPVS